MPAPSKNVFTFSRSSRNWRCASSSVGACTLNVAVQTARSDFMFLRAEPLTLMNCEFFILTHAVVPSMDEKTRPPARKRPASIPKSCGRERFMASKFSSYVFRDHGRLVRHQIWIRRNVQIARATLGDVLEYRAANLAAVITFLRLVHHDGDAKLRV